MSWDLNGDCFVFSVIEGDKSFTRRGLLLTMNFLYDPVGFIAPITVGTFSCEMSGLRQKWKEWLVSLRAIHGIKIPRMCFPLSLSLAMTYEVHVITAWLCLGYFFWRYALLSVSCKAKLPCLSRKLDLSHTPFYYCVNGGGYSIPDGLSCSYILRRLFNWCSFKL